MYDTSDVRHKCNAPDGTLNGAALSDIHRPSTRRVDAECSRTYLRKKVSVWSTISSNFFRIRSPTPGCRLSITDLAHEMVRGLQPRYTGSRYTIPQRDTVAGEATARSFTSNNIVIVDGSLMRSPLLRHRVLLSSRTCIRASHWCRTCRHPW